MAFKAMECNTHQVDCDLASTNITATASAQGIA